MFLLKQFFLIPRNSPYNINGVMNGNQLTFFKKCEFDKPLIHKIDSIIDNCSKDCHKRFFHTFEYKRVNDFRVTKIGNIELVNITIADKSKNLYEINEKSKIAREKVFLFIEIVKLTIKIYSNLSNTNTC